MKIIIIIFLVVHFNVSAQYNVEKSEAITIIDSLSLEPTKKLTILKFEPVKQNSLVSQFTVLESTSTPIVSHLSSNPNGDFNITLEVLRITTTEKNIDFDLQYEKSSAIAVPSIVTLVQVNSEADLKLER